MNERLTVAESEQALGEGTLVDLERKESSSSGAGPEMSASEAPWLVWFPEGLLTHPYCELLYRALARRGIQRRDATGFWIWRKIRPARGAVFHIHWADHYVISGNAFRTLLKIFAFTLELLVLRARGVRVVWTVHNLKNHENALPVLDRLGSTILAHLATSLIFHCEAGKRMGTARFRLQGDAKCHEIGRAHV